MRKLIKCSFLAGLLFSLGGYVLASNIEPVIVFGLSVGGKFPIQTAECSLKDFDNVKVLCWLGKPGVVPKTGTRLGSIKFPKDELNKFPRWASVSMFKVKISKEGIIEQLTVRNSRKENFHEIKTSISSRFGDPDTESPKNTWNTHASWDKQNIFISIQCVDYSNCDVAFLSPAALAERKKSQSESIKTESQRAISP